MDDRLSSGAASRSRFRLFPASLTVALTPWARRFTSACLATTAFFLALHALYVVPVSVLPGFVVRIAGFLMFFEMVLFFALAGVGLVLLVVVWAPLGLLALTRRFPTLLGTRDVGGAEPGRFRVRPWLYALGWAGIALGHLGLDLDPAVSLVGFTGLVLLLPETWRQLERVPVRARVWARRGVVVVALLLAWSQATDAARLAAIVIFGLTLATLELFAARRFCHRDRFLFAVYALCGVQLVASIGAESQRPREAVLLGSSMAYSFVECGGRLLAAVPRCSPEEAQIELCRRESTVDEFDPSRRFRRTASHRFFGPAFAGRIEQLACLDDRVGLGMDWTLTGDTVYLQSHLEFDPEDPSQFRLGPLGRAAGDGIAYDAQRRRAYYTSNDDLIVMRDLETDEQRDLLNDDTGASGPSDVKYHAKRDAVYALGYYSSLAEIDGEDHRALRNFPVLNPWEMVIDEELDRIYVAGSFGLEVIDLESGTTIARRRLGLGGRRPAFDPCNQVIYVPTTAGARLFAYDRLTLEHLSDVPLGTGIRYPYVMESGNHVLTTNNSSHFAFDSRQLAARVRRGAPSPPPGASCPWEPLE